MYQYLRSSVRNHRERDSSSGCRIRVFHTGQQLHSAKCLCFLVLEVILAHAFLNQGGGTDQQALVSQFLGTGYGWI